MDIPTESLTTAASQDIPSPYASSGRLICHARDIRGVQGELVYEKGRVRFESRGRKILFDVATHEIEGAKFQAWLGLMSIISLKLADYTYKYAPSPSPSHTRNYTRILSTYGRSEGAKASQVAYNEDLAATLPVLITWERILKRDNVPVKGNSKVFLRTFASRVINPKRSLIARIALMTAVGTAIIAIIIIIMAWLDPAMYMHVPAKP